MSSTKATKGSPSPASESTASKAFSASGRFILLMCVISLGAVLVREMRFAAMTPKLEDNAPVAIHQIKDFLSPEQFATALKLLEPSRDNSTAEAQDTKSYRAKFAFNRAGSSFSHIDMDQDTYDVVGQPFSSWEGLKKIREASGTEVSFVPRTDPNRLGVIYYNKPGDHHDLHYDGNNYHGRRWAGIYTLKNENLVTGKPSNAQFQYEDDKGEVQTVVVEPNTLVLFEGDRIKHGVSPAGENDERIVISIVTCDVCERKSNPFLILYQFVVNLVFYGYL